MTDHRDVFIIKREHPESNSEDEFDDRRKKLKKSEEEIDQAQIIEKFVKKDNENIEMVSEHHKIENTIIRTRFKQLLHKRIKLVSPNKLDNYFDKISLLLGLGDLEFVVASLIVESFAWNKFSDSDKKLFWKKELVEIYKLFFKESDPTFENSDEVLVFYQLLFFLMYARDKVSGSNKINIGKNHSLQLSHLSIVNNHYRSWTILNYVESSVLTFPKINERFNKMKRVRPIESIGSKGDMNVILDIIFEKTTHTK